MDINVEDVITQVRKDDPKRPKTGLGHRQDLNRSTSSHQQQANVPQNAEQPKTQVDLKTSIPPQLKQSTNNQKENSKQPKAKGLCLVGQGQRLRKVKSHQQPSTSRRRISTIIYCFCCLRCRRNRGIKPETQLPPPPSSATVTVTTVPAEGEKGPTIPAFLLPPSPVPPVGWKMKIVMVIDLDETLVHSSFKPIENPDFIVSMDLGKKNYEVHVLKRPFVDVFLKRMGELYECVLFTASLPQYADPVTNVLDQWGVFNYRLFRDSCTIHKLAFVKDLSRLGRDLKRTIIFDNAPVSYTFQPENAVPSTSWFDDPRDTELLHLIPFFERLSIVDDVHSILRNTYRPFRIHQEGHGDKFGTLRFNLHKKSLPVPTK